MDEDEYEFEFTEENPTNKLVFTIYGNKGDGKTTLALGFPGRIFCISMDHKTIAVKQNIYNNDNRIKVFDGIKYYDKSPSNILESGKKTYHYILSLLQKCNEVPDEKKPDYILIDGLEVLSGVCEMYMRKKNGLKPFQGVANLNVWKDRAFMMDEIHRLAYMGSRKGVIYTTYVNFETQDITEGNVTDMKDMPKWFGSVMMETDITIRASSTKTKEGREHFAIVMNSKYDQILKSGKSYQVTNGILPIGEFKNGK